MSNFVVSARKYRPLQFEDVVGQQHISQTLKNALQNDHLAHAFLFCGPRGVGKTTCARILAKVINCENASVTHEPCNTCSSCAAFNENASFNIVELDAASNNSVEHIRILIEQVRFQPQQGKYKVFIIDEVHMLSQAAFNAFLKTLEEPPPYAIFILATTEKHKIIPTILSRCQIFDFRRIQIQDMVAHLQHICDTENIKAEQEALHVIAQKADGALRDALSIFDRVISYSGDHINYQDVIENLNVLDYDYFFRVIDAMLSADIGQVFLIFDDILKKGFDPELFINGLGEHLRNLLMCKNAETVPLLEVSEGVKERFHLQASIAPLSFILAALNLINECDVNFKMARNKRLHVEMSLTKLTFLQNMVELSATPLLSEEKKKDDKQQPTSVTVAEQPASPVYEKSLPVAPTEVVSEPLPKVEHKETEVKKTEITSPEPVKPSEPQPQSPVAGMPKLGSLDALTHQIKQMQSTAQSINVELNHTALMKAWNEYESKITSQSLRNAMKVADVTLEGDEIKVLVDTRISKNAIISEVALMDFMRETFKVNSLMMSVELDPNRTIEEVIQKPNKALSAKEKKEKMISKNPLITELVLRLDLKEDYS